MAIHNPKLYRVIHTPEPFYLEPGVSARSPATCAVIQVGRISVVINIFLHVTRGPDACAINKCRCNHRRTNYLNHLTEHICMKWGKSHGEVMGWLRPGGSFAIIRATDLCLQGSRIRWRSVMDMADGIRLPYIVE